MLNKNICKNCRNKIKSDPWTDIDEERWNNGIVRCYKNTKEGFFSWFISIHHSIENFCLYKMEQILKNIPETKEPLLIESECLKCNNVINWTHTEKTKWNRGVVWCEKKQCWRSTYLPCPEKQ
jgi:hypothetical protein